jgi:hypothetical protein
VREIALHILDVLQNAVEAGATRVHLTIDEDDARDRISVLVSDNGRGMDAETAARVTDPFYTTRTTRCVGLGLPLLAAAAERAGGGLVIRSQPGAGAEVRATFQRTHPDRQPLGDMPATLMSFLLSDRAPDLVYVHRVNDRSFEFNTMEVRAAVGEVPLSEPVVRRWLAECLSEGESELENDDDQAEIH